MKKYILQLILLSFCAIAFAKTDITIESDMSAVIENDGLGVEVRFDSDGNWISIKSTYNFEVEINDRRGINKAYRIAELKAKTSIGAWMKQVVSTTTILEEVDEGLSKAELNNSDKGAGWTKLNTRNIKEKLLEISTSSSIAILSGVRVLERKYDESRGEVTVVVGMNRKNINAAKQINNSIK